MITLSDTAYWWRVKAVDSVNNQSLSGVWRLRIRTLGIEQEQESFINNWQSFKIYPNPAKSYFTISCPKTSEHIELKILDVSGKVVKKISNQIQNDYFLRVPLNDIKNGIYFINVNDKTLKKKLIVVK
jgi:hypothetical protein